MWPLEDRVSWSNVLCSVKDKNKSLARQFMNNKIENILAASGRSKIGLTATLVNFCEQKTIDLDLSLFSLALGKTNSFGCNNHAQQNKDIKLYLPADLKYI
jgi:hypothetical protein